MANTFGILAAVALLIGAFVAHKNKGFLEDTIADTQSEESKKATLTNKFNSLTSDITALDTESKQFNTFRDETQEKLDEQVAGNKKTQDSIDSKKGAADSAQAKADAADETLKELGDVVTLVPRMKALRAAVRDLEDEISINSAQVDRLTGTESTTLDIAKNLAKKLGDRVSGSSYFESTSVRSIFRQWGFVTLAGGDNIGVVKKSKLSVLRDGEEIAQLIVTGVEANTSAANIIPSSVKGDVTVSPGDKVVPLTEEGGEAK